MLESESSSRHPIWLISIVLVKKENKQIRCCIDFPNLRKACPKYEFHLLNIDMLVGGILDIQCFPSWMGSVAIIRSKWIYMDEKISFQTHIGNFCYTLMLFGLKNACTTYLLRHHDSHFHYISIVTLKIMLMVFLYCLTC